MILSRILTHTLGTRRIEAVAGLSCMEWYRQSFMPVPDLLKMLRVNKTVKE